MGTINSANGVNGANLPTKIILPDIMRNWPFKRTINPAYKTVEAESTAWYYSFRNNSDKIKAAFVKCKPSLLAAMSTPLAPPERLRLAADLLGIFQVYDDTSDALNVVQARELEAIALDGLKYVVFSRPASCVLNSGCSPSPEARLRN
jgi:hypothetical protein